jgi:hypothetical protein
LPDDSHAPVALGTLEVMPPKQGSGPYRVTLPLTLRGEVTLLVECAADGFPFQRYCRFVRQRSSPGPYTFPAMEFSPEPDGIRVGPWPGWRDIPRIPVLGIRYGSVDAEVRESFWGDEIQCSVLRYVSRLDCADTGELVLTSPDPRIVPKRTILYSTTGLKATGMCRSGGSLSAFIPGSSSRPTNFPRSALRLVSHTEAAGTISLQ